MSGSKHQGRSKTIAAIVLIGAVAGAATFYLYARHLSHAGALVNMKLNIN